MINISTTVTVERADGSETTVSHEAYYPAGDNPRFERYEVAGLLRRHNADVVSRFFSGGQDPLPASTEAANPGKPEGFHEGINCPSVHEFAGGVWVDCEQVRGHRGMHSSDSYVWH